MKSFYLFMSFIILHFSSSAQFELGGSYSLSLPRQEMASNIQPLHSLNSTLLYRLPGKFSRVAVGSEIGIGLYAFVSKDQDLRFPDGSGINTTVVYSSNVFQANLLGRVRLFEKAKLNPYINGKGGYANFFSNVTIEDPDDPSACRPLDRKNLINDHTFYFAYGGGVELDLSLFSKNQKQGVAVIDIAANSVRGGNLDYINTKNIQEHVHVDPNNPPPSPQPGKSTPLNVRFINVSTQAIHEHQVAEVYNSPLRMLDIRIGVRFRLR